jgi:hypothetical protein
MGIDDRSWALMTAHGSGGWELGLVLGCFISVDK